jgi:type I restriction enzyme S subunit
MKVGWQAKQLGDLCEVIAGQSPEGKFYNAEGKGMPFYQGKKNFGEKFIEAPTTWTTQTTKVAKNGDILMSVRAPVGPVNFATDEICIGRGLAAIRSGAELNRDFLFYQLWHLQPEIAGREGAVFSSINKAEIAALPLAFAPLPEQQRIVAILDEAFDDIATAKVNAEKNLQNARALFESHLQSVFTQRGAGWEEKTLGEMVTFRNGINFTKSSKGEPIKILGVKDFQSNYWAPLGGLDSVIPDGTLADSDTLKQNDMVFVRSNGNPELIGRCLLVGEISERTTHSGFTIRARLHTSEILPNYLCRFLKSNKARREMIDGGNGANIRSLNQGTLSRLVIPFPSAAGQARIVNQLKKLQSETQRLESIYQQKLATLDALEKSLLHQAFSGQL